MSEPGWVVRGGVATPRQLQDGVDQFDDDPARGGLSVQYQPGCSVEQLAAAGRLPNAQISVTTAERLLIAAADAGYRVELVRTPGRGYHHELVVPYPLPDDLARALSAVFTQRPNPARVRRF